MRAATNHRFGRGRESAAAFTSDGKGPKKTLTRLGKGLAFNGRRALWRRAQEQE